MNPKEIIKSINQTYSKLNVPQNLRLHMYRTTAITEQIIDNWTGPKLNKDELLATMLIHDLGKL